MILKSFKGFLYLHTICALNEPLNGAQLLGLIAISYVFVLGVQQNVQPIEASQEIIIYNENNNMVHEKDT